MWSPKPEPRFSAGGESVSHYFNYFTSVCVLMAESEFEFENYRKETVLLQASEEHNLDQWDSKGGGGCWPRVPSGTFWERRFTD